jgi:hypothetical protein
VRAGIGIRERVHDLTLEALRSRRFDSKAVREVVQAVSEGIALGAESSRAEVRQSLADAFRGLDDALRKSAEAGQTALRQIVATGRGFTENDLKAALASMKRLEEDFLSTVTQVADAAGKDGSARAARGAQRSAAHRHRDRPPGRVHADRIRAARLGRLARRDARRPAGRRRVRRTLRAACGRRARRHCRRDPQTRQRLHHQEPV